MRITALEYYLPHSELTNTTLAQLFPEWSIEKIASKTGITSRRIVSDNETALDIGLCAAKKIFANFTSLSQRVDLLIFCTQSPDFKLPPNACIAQHKLNLSSNIIALDIAHGCSGFIYTLSTAKAYIESGLAKCALCITAETYSKYLATEDKGVRTIFGDGAAAFIIEPDSISSIENFVFFTNGDGWNNLIVPGGGARKTPHDKKEYTQNGRTPANLFMNGPEVFQFSLRCVPELLDRCLSKANMSKDDIDYFIFHQANTFMLEELRKKCDIPTEKFIIQMKDIGNTVSSSIPIALKEALNTSQIQTGSTLFLAGFGVGYSAAACLMIL